MSTVSTLLVNLKVSTGAFTKGLRTAQSGLGSFASGIGKIGGLAVKGFALVGGAAIAAGTALAIPVSRAMEQIDALGKMSDTLGISTEALRSMGWAAEQAGVSQEGFNTALKKMQQNLGSGASDKMLEKMGLDSASLKEAGTEEAFKTISQRISEIPNAADKSAAAVALFGRAGQDLLPVINSGRDGIEAMQREAEKMGITFSRLDAARVEAANDAVNKLKTSFSAVWQTLAIAVAPYIQLAADYLVEKLGDGGGKALDWIKEKMSGFVKVIGWAVSGIEILKGVFNSVAGFIYKGWSLMLKGASKVIGLLAKAADFFGLEGASDFLKVIEEIGSESSKALNEMGTEKWDKAGENFSKAFSDDTTDNIKKQLEKNDAQIKLQQGALPEFQDLENETAKAKTKKSADALSYNASLINVKALGSNSDPVQKEIAKDVIQNKRTADNTALIAQKLDNLALA